MNIRKWAQGVFFRRETDIWLCVNRINKRVFMRGHHLLLCFLKKGQNFIIHHPCLNKGKVVAGRGNDLCLNLKS